ncbi:MAG TPA: hypothetical protein VKA76_08305 [Gammaproteobacteria bacterium]|nr:hypothetical protein [Gammaproteobacteria bacterium]
MTAMTAMAGMLPMASESVPGRRLERLVLALDSAIDDGQRLRLAARLAARLEVELSGLFVEDIALHRLADLPIAIEVSLLAAQSRTLASSELERRLRVQAARLEAALGAAAQAAGVPWSFRALRGRPIREALTSATERDLVLVAGAGRYPLTGRGRAVGPVAVIFDASSAGTAALAIAARVARLEARRLLVLVVGADTDSAALLERARFELGTTPLQADYLLLGGGQLLEALTVAARVHAELLVTDLQRIAAAQARTLEGAPCAIAVVR